MILLIAPPVAKPGEPPAGIALLAGALRQQGVACTLVDASLEGLLFLLGRTGEAADTWSKRALRGLDTNLAAIRAPKLYRHPDRYQRAVRDLNRALELATRPHPHLSLGFANYQDDSANPLDSRDLLAAAEQHETSLFAPYFSTRLPALVAAAEPRLVGISLSYLSQALPAFALIGFLRSHFPQLPLVLGGGLISSWMSAPEWNHPFRGLVDHCIKGPGEGPLLELLGVKGLTDAPMPDYSDLPLQDYLAPGPILPYAASRGCYWNRCSFCPETAEQSRYTQIEPLTVTTQLRQLCAQSRPVLIHLLDNAVSPALMTALADHPPGQPWYGFARVHEQLADADFCRRLRASGCVLLKLGLESGSQAVLDAMAKGIRLDLVARVLASLKAAGIATYVYLLFGTPSESLAEARQTLEFTVRYRESITFLNLAIFNMPRSSSEAAALPGAEFSESDLSLYRDFTHPRGWDRRAVRTFLDREFKRQPQIAAIIRRDPPLFTSNHAAFFCGNFPWSSPMTSENSGPSSHFKAEKKRL